MRLTYMFQVQKTIESSATTYQTAGAPIIAEDDWITVANDTLRPHGACVRRKQHKGQQGCLMIEGVYNSSRRRFETTARFKTSGDGGITREDLETALARAMKNVGIKMNIRYRHPACARA